MPLRPQIVKATPRAALLVLDQLVWPIDTNEHELERRHARQTPDRAAQFDNWRESASQVVLDELMVLAGVRWGDSVQEKYVERDFPATEYHQLQSAPRSTVHGTYRTLAEIPFLARLDHTGCTARINRLHDDQFPSEKLGSCSVALVNIQLDSLGVALYKSEHRSSTHTANDLVKFTDFSRWNDLRGYLLEAITFDLAQEWASIEQYRGIRDIMNLTSDVEAGKWTVAKVWKHLEWHFHRYDPNVLDTPHWDMLNMLHNFAYKHNFPLPAYAPSSPLHALTTRRDAAVGSSSGPELKGRLQPRSDHTDRSDSPREEAKTPIRARSPPRHAPTTELSLRKRFVYGYRS